MKATELASAAISTGSEGARKRVEAGQPREQRDRRDEENRDLRRRGERDLGGELDLASVGDHDGPAVLGCVADDGDDYGSDEELREAGLLGEDLERAHEDLRHEAVMTVAIASTPSESRATRPRPPRRSRRGACGAAGG